MQFFLKTEKVFGCCKWLTAAAQDLREPHLFNASFPIRLTSISKASKEGRVPSGISAQQEVQEHHFAPMTWFHLQSMKGKLASVTLNVLLVLNVVNMREAF